ncbi:YciI family protein [Psychroserpens algicola]|uniref:YciI family protein n=1 Tax=Psychroserpens algicola TaxID=1719034 RepID=A0ABT0H5X0_9FLAO|nr:YciI family protein [Psychroserpens algicola]MCK8479773.1 YciI family protein [Psychroserpens algicola]
MQEFLLLIQGNKYLDESPESLKRHLDDYNKWVDKLMKSGKYMKGNRLSDETKFVKKDGTVLMDGPFLESKEIIGGFVLIKASNFDEALDLTLSCPLSKEFNIFIRPLIPYDR